MVMFRLILLTVLVCVGCGGAPKTEVSETSELPILKQSTELTTLPEHKGPIETGEVVAVEEGEEVPFSGILLTEDKAMAAAELRIAYDEVYRLAVTDRKYMLTVITILEDGVQRADKIIVQKNEKIDELQNDWWQRNKLQVGLGIGIVVGVGLSLATGFVWAEIEEDKK